MAVVAKWMCDRDNTMFDSKKEADEYDKMLELGEKFSQLLLQQIPGVDEAKAEEFGILLAKNKDLVAQACKGKTEALEELLSPQADNVRPLAKEA
ncbi:YebG family protein [Spongiibacter taiwanensis]|uniref:YebG family protein n=1 Tax=Spongiibacter taiwanensis TaxID=1748242 RepID=UPI0020355C26|nr:YebG family protein [Spongiibacter taiwanensis]USA43211.1 YebG family protein [Spongiibacter taiwanensis]